MKLNAKDIKTVTEAVQRHYFRHDDPPPRRVTVQPASIRRSARQTELYTASVEIESEYIPKKPRVHKVDIRFRLHGTVLDPRTLGYVMLP